jgi:hypothetical protein
MATLRALSLPRTLCGGALTPAAPRRAAAGLPAARSGSGRRTCGLLRPAASTWEGGSDQLSLGIVGDLHLEAGPQMALFEEAREHLKAALCDTKVRKRLRVWRLQAAVVAWGCESVALTRSSPGRSALRGARGAAGRPGRVRG